MTKTKLEIIGPYTPEHEGPFCTRDGMPVDLRIRDGRGEYRLIGYIGERTVAATWGRDGEYVIGLYPSPKDLMNAREVPVAREWYLFFGAIFDTKEKAIQRAGGDFSSIIHVREVMPGEE